MEIKQLSTSLKDNDVLTGAINTLILNLVQNINTDKTSLYNTTKQLLNRINQNSLTEQQRNSINSMMKNLQETIGQYIENQRKRFEEIEREREINRQKTIEFNKLNESYNNIFQKGILQQRQLEELQERVQEKQEPKEEIKPGTKRIRLETKEEPKETEIDIDMKTIKPAEPPSEPPHEIQKEEIKVYLDKDGVYRINGNNVFKKNGEINRTIYRQYRKQIDKFLKENNMENKIPKDEISTLNIIEEEPKPASVPEPEPEPEPVPEQSLTEQLKNKVGVKAKLGRINIFNKDGTISGQFLKNRKALEYVESNLGIKFNTNDEMKQAFGYSSKPRSKKVNKADNETIAEAEKIFK